MPVEWLLPLQSVKYQEPASPFLSTITPCHILIYWPLKVVYYRRVFLTWFRPLHKHWTLTSVWSLFKFRFVSFHWGLFFPFFFFFLQKIDCHKFCPSKSLVTEWSCPQSHLFILVSTFIKWFPILIILSMAFHTAATLMQHFITCPGGCWQLSISRLHSNFNFFLFLFFALTPFPYLLLYFQKKRELDECSKRRGFPLPFNTQTL